MSANSLIYSAAAVASYLVYKGYKLFEVPKELQNIPEIPIPALISSFLSGEPFDLQFDRIVKPVLSKFGYARVWMRGNWEVLVTDPKHAREILGNSEIFTKQSKDGTSINKKMLFFKFFGGNNIGSSDGSEWRRHRRIANPAFKKNWDTDIFGTCSEELIQKLAETNQEPIVVHSLFQKLTLDVLGKGLFSYDFEAVKKGESSHYLKLYNEIMSAAFRPFYFLFPFLEDWVPSRRYYHRKNEEFRGFLLNIIKERYSELKQGIVKNDLLSLIIKASMDETSEEARLTDQEVLNNLAVFFLAGHDTTANTLTSTFYYLAKHPEIQETARQEVISVLGDENSVKIPTTEQLKSMPYINCIIKESMRIITTATQFRRNCRSTTTLSGGLTIPENTFVVIHSWALHHDNNIFPEPEKFNPDRFLDLHGSQDQAWMAFGGGSRMCLGLNFSLIEQRVTMAMLLQKFKFELGPNSNKTSKPTLSGTGLPHPLNMDLCFIPRN